MLRAMPIPISKREIKKDTSIPCFTTRRASSGLAAPIYWATCTEKPVAMAAPIPFISQVLEDTSPIAADALAPRLPTIAESIYCIIMVLIWVRIAGMLSFQTLEI